MKIDRRRKHLKILSSRVLSADYRERERKKLCWPMSSQEIKEAKRVEKNEHLRSFPASKCESSEKALAKKCRTLFLLLLIIPFDLVLSYFPVFFLSFLFLVFSFGSDFYRLVIESSRESFA